MKNKLYKSSGLTEEIRLKNDIHNFIESGKTAALNKDSKEAVAFFEKAEELQAQLNEVQKSKPLKIRIIANKLNSFDVSKKHSLKERLSKTPFNGGEMFVKKETSEEHSLTERAGFVLKKK